MTFKRKLQQINCWKRLNNWTEGGRNSDEILGWCLWTNDVNHEWANHKLHIPLENKTNECNNACVATIFSITSNLCNAFLISNQICSEKTAGWMRCRGYYREISNFLRLFLPSNAEIAKKHKWIADRRKSHDDNDWLMETETAAAQQRKSNRILELDIINSNSQFFLSASLSFIIEFFCATESTHYETERKQKNKKNRFFKLIQIGDCNEGLVQCRKRWEQFLWPITYYFTEESIRSS